MNPLTYDNSCASYSAAKQIVKSVIPLFIAWALTMSAPVSATEASGWGESNGILPREAVQFLKQDTDYEEWGCDTPEGYEYRLETLFTPIIPHYALNLMLLQKSTQGPSISGVHFHGMQEGEFIVSDFLLQELDRWWIWEGQVSEDSKYAVIMDMNKTAGYYDLTNRDKYGDTDPKQVFRCEKLFPQVNP